MQRLRYGIKGMSCAACVAHVERAVRGVLGEEAVFSVSLLTNSLSVIPSAEISDARELARLEERLSAAIRAAGYALLTEPEKKEKTDGEYKKSVIRLILSAIFTLVLMYLSMGSMMGLPIPKFLSGIERALLMAITQLVLTLPVVALNVKFFKNGCTAMLHRAPNMDSLIAVGAGASLVYGVVAIVMIWSAGENVAEIHSWMHDLYFESAAMILTLVSLGKLLEARAKDKASDAVTSLARLSPKFATVIRQEKEKEIPAEEVIVGDTVVIRAGELIPVDGEVIFGEGTADESALTGESMPVEKMKGSKVRAACVLTDGALTVCATGVGEETSLSRIIRLLEDAAASKAPIARIADKVSSVFVPCVLAISLLTLLLWFLITKNVEQAFRSAIAVLVISCPCALGLATPTAITVGIGRGARSGILFCSAEALEKMCGVRTVTFDKTGTVTEGKPSLTDVYSYGTDAKRMLSVAAAVERYSSHPLALAVTRGAEEMELSVSEAEGFKNRVGVGAEGTVEGILCHVGKPNDDFRAKTDTVSQKTLLINDPESVVENGVRVLQRENTDCLYTDFAFLESQGKTAVLVTFDKAPVGVLGISDRIRPDSVDAIAELKKEGVRCLMLTGDNEKTAAFVAKEAGLDEYRAGLLPEDKEGIVRELSEAGQIAMVGDGINDAPALVRADVGIAIGAGTDVAIESADVVLSGNSLFGVVEAYRLSRASIRIIKENLFWALFYNAICIPVAAGLFYPLFHWQLSPMIASAAMSFSSVCVVLNALRLRAIRLQSKRTEKHKKKETDITDKGENEMLFAKNKTYEISVEGMMCQHCVAHVKKALEGVKGVKSAEVDLEGKKATVTASCEVDLLIKAITDAGYTATAI